MGETNSYDIVIVVSVAIQVLVSTLWLFENKFFTWHLFALILMILLAALATLWSHKSNNKQSPEEE